MNDSVNPSTAPKVSLDLSGRARQSQGMEDALAGRWDFDIVQLMAEAWAQVRGFKGTFWATAVVGVIAVAVAEVGMLLVRGLLWAILTPWLARLVGAGLGIVTLGILYAVLYLPIFSVGLARVDGRPGVMRTLFDFKGTLLAAAIAGGLIGLFSVLGFFLLILPALYVTAAYSMTVGILCEHKLSPWEAMELSRKACGHRWLKILGLFLLCSLMTLLGAFLTLGVAVIWLMPWNALLFAVLYRRIFGAASTEAAET